MSGQIDIIHGGNLWVLGNMGTCEMYLGNEETWPKEKGNKGTSINRDQEKSSLLIRMTINLKNNPTKLQGTRGFSQENRGTCNPPKRPSYIQKTSEDKRNWTLTKVELLLYDIKNHNRTFERIKYVFEIY